MANTLKNRALTLPFVSWNQLVLEGFETSFDKKLGSANNCVGLKFKINCCFVIQLIKSMFV
jgi:hypothetical protein